MRIDKLTLKNFRCFESLELDLHPNLTVLVGENASGKTAILEGLATGLGSFFLGIPDAHVTSGEVRRRDARTSMEVYGGMAGMHVNYPCIVACVGEIVDGKSTNPSTVRWSRELASPRSKTTRAQALRIQEAASFMAMLVGVRQEIRLPVVAYYGTQRLWAKRVGSTTKRDLRTRFAGYWNCLDPSASHGYSSEWMKWQSLAEIQDGESSPHLLAIERAVCACIIGLKRYFYHVKTKEFTLIWDDERGIQPFDQLSDGYRNFVAMVADIAWRAVVLNPQDGADAAAKATGVVLIDEVDLHLHPRWQMRVLDDLRRTFPGIQFVVTTHAPSVIGTCPAESLRLLLANGRVESVSSARGLSANEILLQIMGTLERLPEVRELMDEIDAILDSDHPERAEGKIGQLEGILGKNNGAVVRARVALALERGDLDAIVDEDE